jgi:PiT family inorganic phosphate transporter
MHDASVMIGLVVLFALAFDYINGFHDTANAIATVVSTRVLTPRNAILMAAVLNFAGALVSVKVAKTISSGLVDSHSATQAVVLAAIMGAIVWNIVTWRFGIPSSSSHALVGGLVGAAVAHSGTISSVIWEAPKLGGLKWKVLIPLVGSPIAGFIIGFGLMALIFMVFARTHPGKISGGFRVGQLFSSAAMAFAHGQSDAQKSMGIITMALIAFGSVPKNSAPPLWVIIACACAMALGTAAGGWRIIKTMGHRIVRLEPVHGFAAETTAATVLFVTAHYGMPVSTTHTIAGSIFGVGSSKRLSAVRWGVARSMIIAWVLTIPAAAIVSAICYQVIRLLGAQ